MKSPSSTPKTVTIARDAATLAALFATAQSASAQNTPKKTTDNSDSEVLPETVVKSADESPYNASRLSSLKSTAPLLDTPQTTTVIPKEIFNKQGARNLTDVLKNTPGISYNAGENGFGTNQNTFSMRGMDGTGSVHYDGFRDSGNYSRDIFNLERVEIVKGAAADNGRGSAAGYVNLVSKAPTLDNAYSGSISYATDETDASGRFRTSVDINQAIDGALPGTAFRLNAFLQEGGIAGRDKAEANGWGIAPSIAFGLGTDTRVTLSYQYVNHEDRPDWGVNSGPGNPRGFQKVQRIGRDTFYGLTSDYDDTTSNTFLGIIEHDFISGLKLTNSTRISKTKRDADFTMPFGYADATQTTFNQFRTRYDRDNFNLGNQTNFAYEFDTGGFKHTLAAGFEYTYEKAEANRYGTASRPGESVTNPNSDPTGFGIPAYAGSSDISINTFSAYLYDTVELNEQFQLTGGLRLEHYRAKLRDLDAAGNPGSVNFNKNDTNLSGKLGLIYKPADNGSIYGAISASTMPPGALLSNSDASRGGNNGFPGAGAGVNNPDASTQVNWNYEIGTKWDFYDGRLSATAAAFHTVRTNIAITDGTTMLGEGKQKLSGIELGLSGEITDGWDIHAGFLAMTTKRSHFTDLRNLAGFHGRPDSIYDVNGDHLSFAPKYSATLFTTYDFGNGITIGGGMQYVGSSHIGRPDDADRIIPNGVYGKFPSYVTFNALASYELNPNVTLRFNVDNIFDEVYAVSTNWPGVRSLVGPPRTYTISADWSF